MLHLSLDEAGAVLRTLPPPLVVHAPATLRRLGIRAAATLDLLELFAFVLPARPVPPTPRGLALTLDIAPPGPGMEAAAAVLPDLVRTLLARLAAGRGLAMNRDAAALAARMAAAGWAWAPFITAALGQRDAAPAADGLKVWKRLPEWEETPPPPAPASFPVAAMDARRRLASMLGPDAEQRPGQSDFAAAVADAFAPRDSRGDPHLVLAEAGTGTGKTLAYIAPASLWAERNRGAGMDLDLHAASATADRRRTGAPVPRSRRAAAARRRTQGAGKLPLPAEFRRRGDGGHERECARVGHSTRPARALGGWRRATATCRVVTFPAGSRSCSAMRARLLLRTGGASASTPPARIGSAASSSTRSAARAPPTLLSPTMRW